MSSTPPAVMPARLSSHLSSGSTPPKNRLSSSISKTRDELGLFSALAELKMMKEQVGAPSINQNKYKEYTSLDVAFVMDCTGSMQPFIDEAKKEMLALMTDLQDFFLKESVIRIAVIGYRDHGELCKGKMYEVLDFQEEPFAVTNFFSRLSEMANEDDAEHVLGGLKKACSLSWKNKIRCIIHVGDAPPHGNDLNDGKIRDRWREPLSEPDRLKYRDVLKQMISMNISYVFMKITSATDRMYEKFAEVYQKQGSRSLKHVVSCTSCDLGHDIEKFRPLVLKTITFTSLKSVTHGMTVDGKSRFPKSGLTANSLMSTVDEEEEEPKDIEDSFSPLAKAKFTIDWGDKAQFLARKTFITLSIQPMTLRDALEQRTNLVHGVLDVMFNEMSFSSGAMRDAFYARTPDTGMSLVMKRARTNDVTLSMMITEMRCQAICKAMALDFNSRTLTASSSKYTVAQKKMIDFVTSVCLISEGDVRSGLKFDKANFDKTEILRSSARPFSLEPYIEGSYRKYNNNFGYISDEITEYNDSAQAFTHFTFERSKGKMMVVDLQGVDNMLTDPLIHTSDGALALLKGNMGLDGMKMFFTYHECNDICRGLGLLSERSMMDSGNWKFNHFPDVPVTAQPSCTNQLCNKLLTAKEAQDGTLCFRCAIMFNVKVKRVCASVDNCGYFVVVPLQHQLNARLIGMWDDNRVKFCRFSGQF